MENLLGIFLQASLGVRRSSSVRFVHVLGLGSRGALVGSLPARFFCFLHLCGQRAGEDANHVTIFGIHEHGF